MMKSGCARPAQATPASKFKIKVKRITFFISPFLPLLSLNPTPQRQLNSPNLENQLAFNFFILETVAGLLFLSRPEEVIIINTFPKVRFWGGE